ncbi:MAG: 3,4-dihydroxy-2-butanone-4-phosphate synthase [Bdellovibrionota bacterium]|jgi:3,4-dihydroxy 2-butanone 4-phosphate synthase/GTP cyclohydrolase II
MNENLSDKIDSFKERGIALLYDDSSDLNNAVLVAAAQTLSPKLMNDVLELSKGGITSVAISADRATALELQPMTRPRTTPTKLNINSKFCISVDAREGITTGISASDRADTIRIIGEEFPSPRKLVKPGHVFPLETVTGGVLVKNALPEGALDLVKLAGYTDAALFVDVLNDLGDFLEKEGQLKLVEKHHLARISLSDLIKYRLSTEQLIQRVAEAKLPTKTDDGLRSYMYKSKFFSGEHIALVHGEIDPSKPVLTRVQTEATLADVFGGNTPPTRRLLQASIAAIKQRECGIFLYLKNTNLGYLQQQVKNTKPAELNLEAPTIIREYGIGAQILYDLGARKIEILSNSSKNLVGLKSYGIEIVSQIPIPQN